MNLDEAIRELNGYNAATFESRFVTFNEAIQLGIEALKKESSYRKTLGHYILLPGETDV